MENKIVKKEIKHDKFKRIATKRVNDLLKKLDLLENCSNKSHYDYTAEEISKIFSTIDVRLKEVKQSFKSNQPSTEFKL